MGRNGPALGLVIRSDFSDRAHWLVIAPVCVALFIAWVSQYPAEVSDFLESPVSMAPYWLLWSAAGFAIVVYLERALRNEAQPAFAGWEAVLVAIAMSSLCLLIDARAASGLLVALVYLVAAVLRRAARVPVSQWPDRLGRIESVRAIFFLSGSSALFYQVIWQWRLMSFVGANAESVSIIVAVFMAGLGIGGYVGGRLAARARARGLVLFFAIEVGIGVCGVVSLPVLDLVAKHSATVPQGPALIALVAALLMPPTVLMGATLPVLVELMRPSVPALNENVGKLYAINALGSAVAALVAVGVLFPFVGQTAVTWLAASLNGVAALLVWMASRCRVRAESQAAGGQIVPPLDHLPQAGMKWSLLAALAFATGFVTIGQEVLLLRQASWLTAGRAEVFGLGVGCFLLGLASGSWKQTTLAAHDLSRETVKNWYALAGIVAAAPFAAGWLSGIGSAGGFLAILATLFACGFLGARSLPMIAGLLRDADQHRFGTVYFANVLGSVSGSLVLGYWLADRFDLATLMILTAGLTFGVGLIFHLLSRAPAGSGRPDGTLAPAGVAIGLLLLAPALSDRWLERMLLNELNPSPFSFVSFSKSGIVAVNAEGHRKVVYGGGVYDGAISYRANPDFNGIGRVYRALSLHDNPEDVLEIGLSSGSWARALLLDDRVKSLISVEINPAYERLVANFEEVRPILEDPRFLLVSDDGRRWLRANNKAFDMIVSNTTYHWRSGATLITSIEFMRIVKARLKPGGVFLINTTFSENVAATTCEAFKYCVRIGNAIAASDSPFDLSPVTARSRLSRHDQFASMSEPAFHSWLQGWPGSVVEGRPRFARTITDESMTDEFRRR